MLEAAAADFRRAHERVADAGRDLDCAVRMINSGWEGDASTAAGASIRTHAQTTEELGATLSLVRRVTLMLADTLTEAKGLLAQADELAAAHGLQVDGPGEAVFGPPATTDAQDPEGARQLDDLVQRALEMAQDADADAARALRAALDAGSLSARQRTALVDEVAAPNSIPDGPAAEVAAWWASLTAGERAALLRQRPEAIGNLDGIPYDVRVEANHRNIQAALEETRAEITELEQRVADLEAEVLAAGQSIDTGSRGHPDLTLVNALANAHERLANARDMETLYTDLLYERTTGFDANGEDVAVTGHQVVLFDPANGAFAEIVGTLGPNTENIAVMVPGTGSNMLNMTGTDSAYDRCLSLVQAANDPRGSLAVISWLGGEMPQDILGDAPRSSYAESLGPKLATFTAGIDNPNGVPVTVAGHSYGGSVVGAAEVAGMYVDRVLHIESAGAGPEVHDINDYAHPATDRYSMTAPQDFISYTQGADLGPLGHGADPDELTDVVQLETGRVGDANVDSRLLFGVSSHSEVFAPGSTAFKNIVGVMTGGDVSLLAGEPEWVPVEVNGQIIHDYQYPMERAGYVPPMMDVP